MGQGVHNHELEGGCKGPTKRRQAHGSHSVGNAHVVSNFRNQGCMWGLALTGFGLVSNDKATAGFTNSVGRVPFSSNSDFGRVARQLNQRGMVDDKIP